MTEAQIRQAQLDKREAIPRAGYPLGVCYKCYGALGIINGKKVQCESCGAEQENHPVFKVPEGTKVPVTHPNIEIPKQDFAATWLERITTLERKVAALEELMSTDGAEPLEFHEEHKKRGPGRPKKQLEPV